MNGSKRSWNRYWTLGSLAVIFAAAAAAMAIGRFTIAPKELAAVLIPGSFPDVQVSGQVRTVISNIRFPRVVLALLSGAGLAAAGAATEVFAGIQANPTLESVGKGAQAARAMGADMIVALGGGSVMDAAKAIALMAVNEGNLWDYVGSGTGKGQKYAHPGPVAGRIAITTHGGRPGPEGGVPPA